MTGRLLSVARDVSGARERAASPSRLPAAPVKQVCFSNITTTRTPACTVQQCKMHLPAVNLLLILHSLVMYSSALLSCKKCMCAAGC